MPTVRGIMRRGITITSLVEFMMEQGPSKNANLMTWDKFWALNYKRIDKIVPRFTAVDFEDKFIVDIVDTDE
jgi:glutamyl-tRNA synthetase